MKGASVRVRKRRHRADSKRCQREVRCEGVGEAVRERVWL